MFGQTKEQIEKVNQTPRNVSMSNIDPIGTINNNSNKLNGFQDNRDSQRLIIGNILENIEKENIMNDQKYFQNEDYVHRSS